jgi:hypothetical protein
MRDSSVVFYDHFALLPGRISGTGIDRLRPLLKTGKGNRPKEGMQPESVVCLSPRRSK